MASFNITRENVNEKINELLGIFLSDELTQTDWSDCIKKLKSAIDSSKDSDIKIALMGSFSDGKTSTIAGMMGELMDDMIIDVDESSDQLTIYRPKGLKEGFVIIDTPGLFGTKEKNVDGKNVKFSKQTEEFISEADIILYVTDATVPIIEDHKIIMQTVLRTYNKLDKTLFVLNKMDAIVDPRDEAEFAAKSEIKTAALIDRLKEIINLSEDEICKVRSVCICADPKEKGMSFWLKDPQKYNKLSRIPVLWKEVNTITDSANMEELKADSLIASVRQVLGQFVFIYNTAIKPLLDAEKTLNDDVEFMEMEIKNAEKQLKSNKVLLRDAIKTKHNSVLSDIDNADFETLGGVLERQIGVQGEDVTFYILTQDVDGILETFAEQDASTLEFSRLKLQNRFEKQDTAINNAISGGLQAAKNINAQHVLKARDLLFKGYKFKPWGATKLAGKIGKAAGIVGVALQGVDIIIQLKRNRDLRRAKDQLKKSINDYFANIFGLFKDDETYYKNFAPSFTEMKKAVAERKQTIEQLLSQSKALESFKTRLDRWYGYDIEDVPFEEI